MSLGNWVKDVTLVKGVAPQQAPQCQYAALDGAVFGDRFIGILGASRYKPAARPFAGGNVLLIESNQP